MSVVWTIGASSLSRLGDCVEEIVLLCVGDVGVVRQPRSARVAHRVIVIVGIFLSIIKFQQADFRESITRRISDKSGEKIRLPTRKPQRSYSIWRIRFTSALEFFVNTGILPVTNLYNPSAGWYFYLAGRAGKRARHLFANPKAVPP
ncbi:MAG TPA: hypothetical protein VFB72_15230, partial [Verrucomicrobiae bacterium]|nr:hypothetical protein [Verrucomicrobiae bacterium]